MLLLFGLKYSITIFLEAISDDGIVEALSIPEHPSFAVAVQWHAEYEPEKNDLILTAINYQENMKRYKHNLKKLM